LLAPLQDRGVPLARRAAWFHESLALTAVAIYRAVSADAIVAGVGATGGVLQNRILAERMQAHFQAAGVPLALPARLPANDAAIAFGQVIECAAAGAPER
jgi:hydrogenase maturation protein HypF